MWCFITATALCRWILIFRSRPKTYDHRCSWKKTEALPSGSAPSSPVTADATPVCLAISRSRVNLTHEQSPEILELLHLGQQLTLSTEGSNPMFPAGNLGLILGGADSQPICFGVCWRLRTDEANRTTSFAKSREAILRSPSCGSEV